MMAVPNNLKCQRHYWLSKIIKGMEAKVLLGYQNVLQNEFIGSPMSLKNPFSPQAPIASAYYRSANYINGTWNQDHPQLLSLGKGAAETLLGGTFKKTIE